MGHCRLCRSEALENVYDLGEIPIAHQFASTETEALARPRYPMNLLVCNVCGMGQFEQPIAPEILYSDYNFCFSTWKAQPHIEDECEIIRSVKPQGVLLEVGCNDGLFLETFAQPGGYTCLGIEPNKVSSQVARDKGFTVINKFFEQAVNEDLDGQRVDVIIARQVLEHIVDVDAFFATAHRLLPEDGLLAIEVPNCEIALTTGDVTCLWEEHVNYFTPSGLKAAFESYQFEVLEERRYLFSGEAVFMLGRKSKEPLQSSGAQKQLSVHFKTYAEKINEYRNTLLGSLDHYHTLGFEVALYGSGCRSSVFLHGLGVDTMIHHVVDDQPEKQALYMAGTHLQVASLERLNPEKKYLFLLSVNKENEDKVRSKITAKGFADAVVISIHSPNDIMGELHQLNHESQ